MSYRRLCNAVVVVVYYIYNMCCVCVFSLTFGRVKDHQTPDQIRIFNNAKTIIGLHGAGFANISFCKPKTQVIELRSIGAGTIIKNIALNNSSITEGDVAFLNLSMGLGYLNSLLLGYAMDINAK